MHIIYKGIDGSVAIATLIGNDVDIDDVVKKFRGVHPEGFYPSYEIVETVEVPPSRQFRQAWKYSKENKIDVNEEKAKQIHWERIRCVRDEQLKLLDVDAIKNISNSTKLAEVEAKKQKLRDVPQNFKLEGFDCRFPEKTWPETLPLHSDYVKAP